MEKIFKSVVFFSSVQEKSKAFKALLSEINFIKVFSTDSLDETQQIVDMSQRTAILLDSMESLGSSMVQELSNKNGQYRKFYLDWELESTDNFFKQLGPLKITCISSKELSSAIERVELYLYGKVNIFNNKNYVEPKVEPVNPLGKALFTHLTEGPTGWKVLVSSHEREENVNEVIGVDWNILLSKILKQADKLSQPKEEKIESASSYQIIFPHIVEGKVRRLSIIHLPIDAKIEENVGRIRSFLQSV